MTSLTNNTNALAFRITNEFKDYILPVSAIFGLFACVGILGNLFVLYVHIFKYKNCNFRFFVLGLCAVDLTSSVTILPLEIYTQLNWYVFPSQWLCKLKAFMNVFTSVASVYVLLLIAIDRHRKVCAPYSWQMTNSSVLIGYGIAFLLTCFQGWPVLIVWGLRPTVKYYRDSEVVVKVCSTDPDVSDTPWRNVFIVLMCPHFLAMFVMLILYVLVGRQIFGVVLTLRRQGSIGKRPAKSALKKRKAVNNYVSPDISVGGISSASEKLDSENNADNDTVDIKLSSKDEDEQTGVICYDPKESSKAECTGTSIPKEETTRNAVSFRDKESPTNKSRKISTDSKESTDMELVIYEIEDNGICVKKSKIAKSSKKKKRKSKRKKTNSAKRKPNYTDSLKRSVRFSVSARDRLRRRTLITFVFTAIFISTTIMYIIFSFRVTHDNATQSLSFSQLAVFLFMYRLYFINSVIHPILYGFLDPRFRKTLKNASKMVVDSVIRNIHEADHRSINRNVDN